ncbi:DUF2243 domain-containing protein [Flavobacterium sp.]|uniref:DUF2243 domain-containing protein n=1 Tax=Flavobacterium sp. TaxID=239 RepID=UPI002B6CD01E|nr:DUF2243 domain-containing protein [Flavobacterium sp.]HSD06235.1 DUF2243 domain-containing protein [Flavobacterium sp.]
MKITNFKFILTTSILVTTNGYSCVNCNKQLQNCIAKSYDLQGFKMFSAFIVLTIVLILLTYFSLRSYKHVYSQLFAPQIAAALIIGIGMGGFADGIVLHQILQWHQMLSNSIPSNTLLNKSVNMFWDGIFHLFTFLATTIGIYLLWRLQNQNNINKSVQLLIGGNLTGWGIFNLIEGIINHQILKLHNVREATANPELWNYGFLMFGITLLIAGFILIKNEIKKVENL